MRTGILAATLLGVARAGPDDEATPGAAPPPAPVRVHVAASPGRIIPLSRGGGGFQRTFRFRARPGRSGCWIRQVLEVRGTVLDAAGRSSPAHLDVVEYYRVDASGRTIQPDSHHSQYPEHCGGDLTIRSTLTYGTLETAKLGDTIVRKSFILRDAKDATGESVTMRTRKGWVIPAERGARVAFKRDAGSIPSHYEYRVQWDARPGQGPRTQPSGEMETGTWYVEPPPQTGHTVAVARPQPIPDLHGAP